MKDEHYGKYYFRVEVPKTVNERGRFYFHADKVSVVDGAMVGESEKGYGANIIIAPGKWHAVYAASVFDGRSICIEDHGE